MIARYHSCPYSIPAVPLRSDERNDFRMPPLASVNRLPKASARSASRLSWLMKTSGFSVATSLASRAGATSDCRGIFLRAAIDHLHLLANVEVTSELLRTHDVRSFTRVRMHRQLRRHLAHPWIVEVSVR